MTKEEIIKRMKSKKVQNTKPNHPFLRRTIYKTMLSVIIFLITLIVVKNNPSSKEYIKKQVYDTNMSFMTINNLYKKYLGDIIPFSTVLDTPPVKQVFNEKLEYTSASIYKDGVSLEVNDNYLVPFLESGLVVFIGEKEDYGQTIIIQGVDGVDIWYSNVTDYNLKLYDYVTKGTPIGSATDKKLILAFNKEGEFLDYNEYIN